MNTKKINNGTTEVLVEKYYEEVLVLLIVACPGSSSPQGVSRKARHKSPGSN
jgi:hypothetical protein